MTTQQERIWVRTYQLVFVVAACVMFIANTVSAQETIGSILPYASETAHTYPTGNDNRPVVASEAIVSKDAKFVMVHFAKFSLAAGDYLTVSNPDNSQSWTYDGTGPNNDGTFWSAPVDGDRAVIKLHGGPTADYGYHVDSIGHGNVDIGSHESEQTGGNLPPSICNNDGIGWEDVACHLPNNLFQGGEDPVAIIFFPIPTAAAIGQCTGWLVNSPISNLLITNNHCVASQGVAMNTFAYFHFQRRVCGRAGNLPVVRTRGVNLVRTNAALDYTLLTVNGNPQAQFGVITPTTKGFNVRDQIWIVQHPAGFTKKVGWFEDAAHTVRCTIKGVGGNGQAQYTCDTFGGSSGSPVEDPATAHALALHNLGAVGACPPNLNSGNSFVNICANAGAALLTCANN